jgi:hypothetical protein
MVRVGLARRSSRRRPQNTRAAPGNRETERLFMADDKFQQYLEAGKQVAQDEETYRATVVALLMKIGDQLDDNLVDIHNNQIDQTKAIRHVSGALLATVEQTTDVSIDPDFRGSVRFEADELEKYEDD